MIPFDWSRAVEPLTAAQIATRFGVAAGLTTAASLVVGTVLLWTTGVPETYPPLRPLQIVSGTVGGAFLAAVGYALLTALVHDQRTLATIFVAAGVVLLVASFHLPYRLSYTTSLRFAGVTVAAQVGQGFLHTLVVGLSIPCFLYCDPTVVPR